MRLDRVTPGDRVTVNVRGWRFGATVTALDDTGATIAPDAPHITYRRATARQIEKVHRWDPRTSQHTG